MTHLFCCRNRSWMYAALVVGINVLHMNPHGQALSLAGQQQAAPQPPPVYLGANFDEDSPPVVGDVLENSPAEKAGIKEGDIILRIGNVSVKDVRSTVAEVRKRKPGDEVTIGLK